ncbi:MAG: rubredoxin [Candidatus Methanomethylophilaceae archaeon]|nr:rubredoxin [Candidatus Methanomethylophilaceae archaeon]
MRIVRVDVRCIFQNQIYTTIRFGNLMKYRCPLCGYVYDEEEKGVPFADLPDDWICPVCGEPKSEFVPVE